MRRARWLLAGLAGLAYLASISPYPVPGESATLLAAHADLMPVRPLTQPVWGVVVRLLEMLVPAPLGLTLNVFSTLCAVAGVGLFYLVLWHIPIHPKFHKNPKHLPSVVAFVGSLYFLTSMPAWLSGNRASPESLDLLLFMGSLYFLVRHAQSQRLSALSMFAFLYGLAMLDSPALLAAAPLVGVLTLVVLWFRSHIRWRQLGSLALGGAGAVAFSGLSAWLYVRSPSFDYWGFTSFWQVWKAMANATWEQSSRMGERTGWLILGLGLLLPLVWSVTCMVISPKGRRLAPCFVIHALFTVAGPVLLLNIPASPWVLAQTKGFPLLPALMLATGVGLAAGFWVYALGRLLTTWVPEGSWVKAETVVTAAAFLCLMPAAGLTFLRVRPHNAELFHWAVTSMLDALPPRQWLITDGSLDPLLAIEARDRGQSLILIRTDLIQRQEYRRYLAAHLPDMTLRMLAYHSPNGMLRAWLQRGAQATRELASAENGQLWAQMDRTALPDRGIYGGSPPQQTSLRRLSEQQVLFWKGAIERLERLGGHGTAAARAERDWLARRLSRNANAHGCLLDRNGMRGDAEAAYIMARRLHSGNVVALVNLQNLRNAGATPAKIEEPWKELPPLAPATHQSERVSTFTREWGPLRDPRAYELDLAAFGNSAVASTETKVDPQIARVIEVRRNGRPDEAIALCRELVTNPGSPEAWCLLGCLAFEKGDMQTFLDCLDHVDWERQKTVAGAQLHLLAGLRALTSNNLPLARQHLGEALKARPDDLLALEYLVGICWPPGFAEESWGYLDRLLALDPGSFAGNATMGYVFAQQEQYDLAEHAFRTAIKRRPNAVVLNNLAWVLHFEGKNQEALRCAKDSIALDPNSGKAWHTYGCILQHAQQTAAAGKAFAKAAAISPDDVSIQLDCLEWFCAGRRWNDAATQLASLRARISGLSGAQRERLAALEARIEAGTGATAEDRRP